MTAKKHTKMDAQLELLNQQRAELREHVKKGQRLRKEIKETYEKVRATRESIRKQIKD